MALKPAALQDRELHVTGSRWRDVLAVNAGVVSELVSLVDSDVLHNVSRHAPPEASVDILIGDETVALWLGGRRLAAIPLSELRR
jgi:hypothetical protein